MPRRQKNDEKKVNAPKYSSRALVGSILIFLFGAGIASLFWYYSTNAEIVAIASQIKPLRQGGDSYQFINPLLGYDLPGTIQGFDEYQPMVTSINNLVAAESSSAPGSFSFYFRDLTLGRWAGINQDTVFAPGSMMKVVLMIAYFKEAEADLGSVLHQTLVYSSSTADQLNGIPFETPSNLVVGESYTVEQLIEAMIDSSDNGAKNALFENVDQGSLNEIYTDLGIPYLDPNQNYDAYAISAKQYSTILRVLYGATYLSRDYSEKALQIISQAEYNQGLVAGVPGGTPVAQKFGESVTGNARSPKITLSNCGVVYQSTHPYILCVMTEGYDLNNLTQTIASISRDVWNEVNAYSKT